MRLVSKVLSFPLYADTSSPVGMIHKDKFTPVGVGFFNRWEFSRLRPEGVFLGAEIGDEYEKNHVERSSPASKV